MTKSKKEDEVIVNELAKKVVRAFYKPHASLTFHCVCHLSRPVLKQILLFE